MRVNRVDIGRMGATERTPQGFLRVPADATRTGVFEYRNPDGTTRRELRHPEDVFDAASLASLANVPVTDEHPPEMVNARNAKKYAGGWTGETVKQDGDLVTTVATLMDEDLIGKVERGNAREVSCGYSTVCVEEPGTYEGQHYDARQTEIRYNHLAVVPRGRAGPRARLRIDAAEQVDPENPHDQPDGGHQAVTKIKIDGVEYEVSETAAKAMGDKMRADAEQLATLTTEKTALQTRVDTERANVVTVQAKLDTAEKALKERTDAGDVQERVDALIQLREDARAVLGADFKFDKLDESAIRTAVVAKAYPDVKLDGESADFVAGLYKGAIATAARTDSTADLRGASREAAQAGARQDGEAARAEMQKRSDEMWMKPLDYSKEVK